MEIRYIGAPAFALEDYYGEMATSPTNTSHFTELGRGMVVLLRQLRFVEGPMVWAVTSHAKLRLIATDDFTQPVLMGIYGWRWDSARPFTFAIDYALPDGEVPWPGARVSLETSDLSQACEMVAYGLSKATGTAYTFRKPTDPASVPDPSK